jgi:CDP-diacylglycerol--glycerol-3-phosphate 3-phosphatidyltransferase
MPAQTRLSLNQLEDLLDDLRAQDFRITPEQQLRIAFVWRGLASGEGARDAAAVLSPLIARSAEEQARCRYAVEAHLRALRGEVLTVPPSGDVDPTLPPPRRLDRGAEAVRRLLAWMVANPVRASSLVLAAATGLTLQGEETFRQLSRWLGVNTGTVQADTPGTGPVSVDTPLWMSVLVLLVVGGLLFTTLWLARSSRTREDRAEIRRLTPEETVQRWPLHLHERVPAAFRSKVFYATARELRRRESTAGRLFDLEASLRDTVRVLGYPALRFRPATRPTEYLALVERDSPQDQQAQYFTNLCRHLRAEGVPLAVWSYEGDPRVVHGHDDSPGVPLTRIRERHLQSRWLVFGSGHGLLDPVFGDLLPWVHRLIPTHRTVLLTPEPQAQWGAPENALASHFIVVPASLEGLSAGLQELGAESPAGLPMIHAGDTDPWERIDFDASVGELRQAVKPRLFSLVAGCAVFPELNWPLILHLSGLPELVPDGATASDLRTLVRLPWFRAGTIPDRLRLELMDQMSRDVEAAIRLTILRLLDEALATCPDPVKAVRLRADQLSQRLLLYRDEPAARDAVVDDLLQAEQGIREAAMVRLLRGRPGSPLSFFLPARVAARLTGANNAASLVKSFPQQEPDPSYFIERRSRMAFLPGDLREQGIRLLTSPLNVFVRSGLSPNVITTIGFVVTMGAGLAYFLGSLQWGGFLVLLGGLFDVIDGYVARKTERVTRFGSFYDSTLDRISEVMVFLGVFSLYNGNVIGEPWMVYVVTIAMAGSLMVSYTRARAAAMGIDCRVGLMQRAERVLLLGISTLFFATWREGLVLTWVMLAMAVLTNLTLIYRIYWVYQHTRAPTAPVQQVPTRRSARTPAKR